MSTCRELQMKAYLSIHQSSVPSHLAAYHRSVEEAETERERGTHLIVTPTLSQTLSVLSFIIACL